MDSLHMYGEDGLRRWQVQGQVIRVTARSPKETWVYQFPAELWREAVRRVMADMRKGVLTDLAAGGLLEMIAEATADDD